MFCRFHEQHQKGFTLIELIIVIAILAILSAIALSRLNYNRATAANRVCNTKMGELKKAAEAYFLESGNFLGGNAVPIAPTDISGADPLIIGGYLKGVPSNPHSTVNVGSYTVFVTTKEAAEVTCPGKDAVHTDAATFGGDSAMKGHI